MFWLAPKVATQVDIPRSLSFEHVVAEGEHLPRLHSLLVSLRGELLLEHYFHGIKATRHENIKSASKSVISALVGVAIDRGLIRDVRQPIAEFLPELSANNVAPEKKQITIEDLLTMRSGLETTSNRNYGAWVRSSNWVRWALNRPLLSPPGEQMIYSTGNTHLLSAILTKASGGDTRKFAQEALGDPLGFTVAAWPRDPQGVYFGGNDMLMRPKDMLKIGELYLHRGRASDKQVIPEPWIDASWTTRTRSSFSDQEYGYGWWKRDMAGFSTYFAWGFGGQYIFVVPDLDVVVVSTSSADPDRERRTHRRNVLELIEDEVIGQIASVEETALPVGGARVSSAP
jgi:CubicO group peptidase (beta-lactamase class C family)